MEFLSKIRVFEVGNLLFEFIEEELQLMVLLGLVLNLLLEQPYLGTEIPIFFQQRLRLFNNNSIVILADFAALSQSPVFQHQNIHLFLRVPQLELQIPHVLFAKTLLFLRRRGLDFRRAESRLFFQ